VLVPVGSSDPGTARVAGRRPELAVAVSSHFADLERIVGAELLERCRARVQSIVAGTPEAPAADGADTDVVRACLALTEQFCFSAQWVTDDQIDSVLRYLEPGRLFALIVAVSLAERWYRLTAFLDGTSVSR